MFSLKHSIQRDCIGIVDVVCSVLEFVLFSIKCDFSWYIYIYIHVYRCLLIASGRRMGNGACGDESWRQGFFFLCFYFFNSGGTG